MALDIDKDKDGFNCLDGMRFRGERMRSSNKTKRSMDDKNNKMIRCLGRLFLLSLVSSMGLSIKASMPFSFSTTCAVCCQDFLIRNFLRK